MLVRNHHPVVWVPRSIRPLNFVIKLTVLRFEMFAYYSAVPRLPTCSRFATIYWCYRRWHTTSCDNSRILRCNCNVQLKIVHKLLEISKSLKSMWSLTRDHNSKQQTRPGNGCRSVGILPINTHCSWTTGPLMVLGLIAPATFKATLWRVLPDAV